MVDKRRANLSGSRRSVPALHLFKAVQTETVRLHLDASARFRYREIEEGLAANKHRA
jgi:hypothetical protein